MLSSRTIIGIVVGSAIIAIGAYSLFTSFGPQQIDFDDTISPGESTAYQFYAPKSFEQWVNVTGDSFNVHLRTPRGGLQIPQEDFTNELSLQWTHLLDGESYLKLQNIGSSDLNAKGYFTTVTDPIQVTYHLLVIIAGVVIIGFSAGFSVRKPKGF